MRHSDNPALDIYGSTNANRQRRAVGAYGWLALGFALSGCTAFALLRYGQLLMGMGSAARTAVIMGTVQVIAMLWLVFKLEEMPAAQTKRWFVGYSVLSGVCLPMLFLFFTQHILLSPFFLLAAMYGLSAAVGYALKLDMSRAWTWGALVIVGFALNVYLNLIWRDDRYQFIVSSLAVLILFGATIDQFTQKPLGASESTCALKAAFSINLNVFFLFIILVLSANERKTRNRT